MAATKKNAPSDNYTGGVRKAGDVTLIFCRKPSGARYAETIAAEMLRIGSTVITAVKFAADGRGRLMAYRPQAVADNGRTASADSWALLHWNRNTAELQWNHEGDPEPLNPEMFA